MKKLFDEKLMPAIDAELKARDTIVDQRQQIEKNRLSYTTMIDSTEKIIRELEKSLDEKVIAGKSVDDLTSKINGKTAEKAALERQIQRLTDTDIDLAIKERNANQALSVALGQALDALRGDVQALVESHLNAAISVLIEFENTAHATENSLGVELEKTLELSVFRFLNMERIFKDLESYVGPIGEDFSAVRRNNLRKEWAVKNQKVAA